MANKNCKYSNSCPVFEGTLTEKDKSLFVVRNVFCYRGTQGWGACKRFHVYELGIEPPEDLLPGNNESAEHIVSKIK